MDQYLINTGRGRPNEMATWCDKTQTWLVNGEYLEHKRCRIIFKVEVEFNDDKNPFLVFLQRSKASRPKQLTTELNKVLEETQANYPNLKGGEVAVIQHESQITYS